MEDSIIFNDPLLLILLAVALFLSVFDIFKRSSGYVFPLISIVLTLGVLTYALLLGATMYEVATVLMVFAAVNLLSFGGKEAPTERRKEKLEEKKTEHEEQGGLL